MSFWDMTKLASQYKEVKRALAQIEVETVSRRGNVQVLINGQQEVLAVRLNPHWLNNAAALEIAGELRETFNRAQQQTKERTRAAVNKITGLDPEALKGVF
ncbi:YbaB/EbfC family nucleoid-associated protein [Desulfofalx alkaliphila]|uniref:YbaB/EbfC family nucleoid-associated protein n=1 Tax=Desulfofalx alkaliphila TaxID=105483 RepID=UPI0004E0B15F|nr:YbaB/EbfC family nucleoid-associated protein [Desulfofalx alkaliphila]